jgi:dolichol-phosphate mannosyltransferase
VRSDVNTVDRTPTRERTPAASAGLVTRRPAAATATPGQGAAAVGDTVGRGPALPPGARALVIIPTYNERDNVGRIVHDVLAQDDRLHVLVVDDASPDGTGEIVDAMATDPTGVTAGRVHVLHRAGKLGLGTAYVAGFRWALARDYALVFEMDADFSHDPAHLGEFLAAADDADVVLGSRYQYGKVTVVNWPIARLILSYSANVYARAVTGLPVYDATGGFKCFRRQVLAALDLDDVRSNGYAFQIEMSFRAWRRGFRIAEVPIVFHDRTEGESKMSGRIVREAVWMVWRLRWWALRGRL